MSKAATLQKALEITRAPATKPARVSASPPSGKTPSRAGKIQVNVWLSPAYKRSLRAVQMKNDRSIQDLISEALNDLFAKYDVPVIHAENS